MDDERDYMLEAKDKRFQAEEARREFVLDQSWLAIEKRAGY